MNISLEQLKEVLGTEDITEKDLKNMKLSLLRDLSSDDFSAFCEYCIPDSESMEEEYVKLQPLHREWCDLLRSYDRLVLFSPIEFGKSTLITVAYPIWCLGNNPNQRIFLISSTYDQACKFLGLIKELIMNSERIQEIFPDLKPAMDPIRTHVPLKWSEDAIIVERSISSKDFSIQALGVEGPLIGARADKMILDDVINLKNSVSPRWRKKIIDWFDTTANTRLVPGSQCIVVGTAWSEADLPHYLASKDEWHVVKYSVEPEDIKIGYRLANWPERWPKERLDKRKNHSPVEYDRTMRNVARTAGKYPFADYIEKSIKNVQLDDSYVFIIGCDLSTKSRSGTVIIVIAYSDKYNEKVIWDIELGAWSAQQKKLKLIEYYDRYHPLKMVVESNSLQDDLVDTYKTYKGADGKHLPIQGIDTRERNKSLWLFELEQELAGDQWIIRNIENPSFARLKDELELYPDYESTDCLMALLFANSATPKPSKKVAVRSTIVSSSLDDISDIPYGEIIDGNSMDKRLLEYKYGFKDYILFHRRMQREGYDKDMPEDYKNIVTWIKTSLDYDKRDKWEKPTWATEENFQVVLSDMVEYVKGLRAQ